MEFVNSWKQYFCTIVLKFEVATLYYPPFSSSTKKRRSRDKWWLFPERSSKAFGIFHVNSPHFPIGRHLTNIKYRTYIHTFYIYCNFNKLLRPVRRSIYKKIEIVAEIRLITPKQLSPSTTRIIWVHTKKCYHTIWNY